MRAARSVINLRRQSSVHHAGSQRAFDGGAGEIGTARPSAERRDEQIFGARFLPILRRARMLERNATPGVILREAAPGCEIQLVGFLQLRQIAFQARTLGEQPEDAPLIEDIDVVLPHHVVDGRQLLAVADQRGSEAGEAIFHAATRQGIGTVSGESGAIHRMRKAFGRDVASRAAKLVRAASSTDPSAIIMVGGFSSPQRALLSMRPRR